MMLTADQCRAARGLLKWTQGDLARRSYVSTVTIRKFETGQTAPTPATLFVIRQALEGGGVRLVDADQDGGSGVRWDPGRVANRSGED